MQIPNFSVNQLLQSSDLNNAITMDTNNMAEVVSAICINSATGNPESAVIGGSSLICSIVAKTLTIGQGIIAAPVNSANYPLALYQGSNTTTKTLPLPADSGDYYVTVSLSPVGNSSNIQTLDLSNKFVTKSQTTSVSIVPNFAITPKSTYVANRFTLILYQLSNGVLTDLRRIVLAGSQSSLGDGSTTFTQGQSGNIVSVKIKPNAGIQSNPEGIGVSESVAVTLSGNGQVKAGYLGAGTLYSNSANRSNPIDPSNKVITVGDMTTQLASLIARITALEASASANIGIIVYFPTLTLPAGWLRLTGSEVLVSKFPMLSAIVDPTWIYTYANGVKVIKLPNLRGQFIRCCNQGSGADVDALSRVPLITNASEVGSSQSSMFAAHDHPASASMSVGGGNDDGWMAAWANGSHGYRNVGTSISIGSRGGNETRPTNVSLVPAVYAGVADYNAVLASADPKLYY